jgi:hypothetical protein
MVSLADSYHMVPRHSHEDQDFTLYPESSSVIPSTTMDMHSLPAEAYNSYPRSAHEAALGSPLAYVDPNLYTEPNYMFNSKPSPGMFTDDADMRASSSNMSTASVHSAASSTVSSPQSNPSHATTMAEWSHPALSIVGQNDYFHHANEYPYPGASLEDIHHFSEFAKGPGYVGESPRVSCNLPRHKDSISSRTSISTVVPDTVNALLDAGEIASPISFSSASSAASRRTSLAFASPVSALSSPFPSPVAVNHHHHHQNPLSFFAQSSGHFVAPLPSPSCRFPLYPTRPGTVTANNPPATDPSMIHHHQHELARPIMAAYEAAAYSHPNSAYPVSPALSASPQPHAIRHDTQSPFINAYAPYSPFQAPVDTSRAAAAAASNGNFMSPTNESWEAQDVKEKQRCTCPDCGKVFKDLKAHMLTHQNERPEKCPIQTCEYHVKGFARKYDKNRHTLTHYKGTMVCGFCPGSGSAAEKSFNRADVFKRHLTAVHGVEQTPPNSRKKQQQQQGPKKLTSYPPDATGKCSTCSQTFANAQEFYEHLDDCVLRIVQQEDPAEAINAKRLAEVENDRDVAQTLEKNNLPTATVSAATPEEDEDEDMSEVDDEDEAITSTSPSAKHTKTTPKKSNPVNGVQKARGMTHSRGGIAVATKKGGRKNRRDYPSSWGFDKGQMTMKKRVITVFDGTHRLIKDDMMLSTDNEVRIRLSDGKSYVTDLDVLTLQRTEAYHNASAEEKASWVADDPTKEEMKRAQEMMVGAASPALSARTA